MLLLSCWLTSVAQFMPGDPGIFLNPIKPPLNFPDHGFQLFAKLSDSMIIQSPMPPNGWKDSVRVDIVKNNQGDVTYFTSKQSITGAWIAQIEYFMHYAYNSNKEVSTFRRTLSNASFDIVNHYSYSYGSNGKVSKATITDSIYLKAQSMWIATPAEETYSYGTTGALEEKLFRKASTGQSTLLNETKWTYSYDANGNCTELTEYLWDESASVWENNQRYQYAYNTGKEMSKATATFWNGSQWEKEDDEVSFTYTSGKLSRAEEINQDGQDDDDAVDYYYNSKGELDHFDHQQKDYGTSTWNEIKRTQAFYNALGTAEFAYVFLWNGSGYEKTASERILFRALSTKAPKAPTGLKVSTSKKVGEKLYLTWTDNSSTETGFIVYRSTDSLQFDSIGSVVQDVSSYTDSSLSANTKYFYRVAAYNGSGLSDFSNTVGATTLTSGNSTEEENTHWIYPNPITDICTLRMSEPITSIKIYDVSGQLQVVERPQSDLVKLDLSLLDSGYYWISCSTAKHFMSKKIVKL